MSAPANRLGAPVSVVAVLFFSAVACGGVAGVPGAAIDASTLVPFDATTDAPASDGTATDAGSGDATFSADGEGTAGDGGVLTRICYAAVCPTGCCTSEGLCIAPSTSAACGYAGVGCTACPAGSSCEGGACVTMVADCGPSNCAGCCEGPSLCARGTDAIACGQGGEQCSRCLGPGETTGRCSPQAGGGGQCGFCYMDCYGCCGSHGTATIYCSRGLFQSECGFNGEDCQACAAGQQCAPTATTGGACVTANPACNSTNCAGCCQGDICAVGDQDVACGASAANCVNCATYQTTCMKGVCS
jgi:hypothetical protein